MTIVNGTYASMGSNVKDYLAPKAVLRGKAGSLDITFRSGCRLKVLEGSTATASLSMPTVQLLPTRSRALCDYYRRQDWARESSTLKWTLVLVNSVGCSRADLIVAQGTLF